MFRPSLEEERQQSLAIDNFRDAIKWLQGLFVLESNPTLKEQCSADLTAAKANLTTMLKSTHFQAEAPHIYNRKYTEYLFQLRNKLSRRFNAIALSACENIDALLRYNTAININACRETLEDEYVQALNGDFTAFAAFVNQLAIALACCQQGEKMGAENELAKLTENEFSLEKSYKKIRELKGAIEEECHVLLTLESDSSKQSRYLKFHEDFLHEMLILDSSINERRDFYNTFKWRFFKMNLERRTLFEAKANQAWKQLVEFNIPERSQFIRLYDQSLDVDNYVNFSIYVRSLAQRCAKTNVWCSFTKDLTSALPKEEPASQMTSSPLSPSASPN